MQEQQFQVWTDQLGALLDQLDKREIALIEFSDPAPHLCNYYARIRIRLTMTPGGLQFGMRLVSAYRGEGSGSYYPRDTLGKLHCVRDAMKEVQRYIAPASPNPKVQAYLEEMRGKNPTPVMSFIGYKDERHIQEPLLQKVHRHEEAQGRGFLPDAATIQLD